MKPFTILCPTDFSECSLNAIEYAARLGEYHRAILVLFHVPSIDDYRKLMGPSETDHWHSFAATKIKNLADTVKQESLKNGLIDCLSVIKEGKTVQTILDYANEQRVDMIVMGTEGVNDFKQNYIGTKTSKVVEQAAQDVFIIPRKVYFKKPRKFVYATDYLEEDKLAIQKVISLASHYNSEVDVVHVGTKMRTIDRALHQAMVGEISPFIKYEKVNYVLKAYRDDPGLGLESYLISAKGDVLFTLSKKKSWFESLFTKNLSRKMSYFINKPLYVIKTV
ncbi:universal stress protein [Lunatimonas lonarensis]|uniref:Universal stress protein n=1 Tax=Lunatimonas lonarensis TaxID=1232681 RepID=R7ZRM1_9BACT|nr:universal stress protein [Lunatimonas lonarensis]EON76727.1 universal stress protein [Lunatimonas lonarensis]